MFGYVGAWRFFNTHQPTLFFPTHNLPVTAGFAIFALVYCTASYSGGHLNPAITIGALAAGKITVMRAVAYIIAQIGGACTGAAFVWTVRSVGGAANQVNADGGYAAAFMAEFLLTFILMFVVLCATDASRYRSIAHLPVLAPFAIGVTVLIAHLAAIPLDGCSLNPARSLATMLLSGVAFWQQWVFWVGPILGALAATYVYELGFRPDYDPFISLESGAGGAGGSGAGGAKPTLYPTN
jgi:aquaporin PIP